MSASIDVAGLLLYNVDKEKNNQHQSTTLQNEVIMDHILVIGGGCAGSAAIAAVREHYTAQGRADQVHIIATTKGKHGVPGADETIQLRLNDQNICSDDWFVPLLYHRPYAATFFSFAYGDIGFPAREATVEQRQRAFNYSVRPLLKMETYGGFGTLFAFGSLHWLPMAKDWYGAMVETKQQLEPWAAEKPESRKLVRSGAFRSASLERIGRVVELLYKRGSAWLTGALPRDVYDLFPSVTDAESMPISEAMLAQVLEEEHQGYLVNRMTTKEDVQRAVRALLEQPKQWLVNVVADLQWFGTDRVPPERRLEINQLNLLRGFCMLPGG